MSKSSETFDAMLDSHLLWQHLEQRLTGRISAGHGGRTCRCLLREYLTEITYLKNIWVLISNILIIWLLCWEPLLNSHTQHCMAASLLTEPLNYDLKEGEVELPHSATASLPAVPNYPGS